MPAQRAGGLAHYGACSGSATLQRVDSGRGQNRTLRLLLAFWPPVFAGEQNMGPPER